MNTDIQSCINTRTSFFEQYYDIPREVQPEVDAFVNDMMNLGENSQDAQDFEAKFASEGFQKRFTDIIVKCTPKAYKMTAEDKAHSKEVAKEIFQEDRKRIIKEAAEEVLDYATVAAEEEMIAQRRKAMIDADVFDDYTCATNAVDMAKDVGGLFKNLFKKKK